MSVWQTLPQSAEVEGLLKGQRFRQATLSKEETSLIMRMNAYSSNTCFGPLQ